MHTKKSKLTSIQLPALSFCQRGDYEYFSVCILDPASVMVDNGVECKGRRGGGGGKEKGCWRSHLMLLRRVSGSEARSQNTHGEQAE